MKYLVLAQYVKTGKKLWWISSANDIWRKGQETCISGTLTRIKIIDVLEITAEKFNELDK